jgi:DNA-binding transcriptional regulator YbjK
MSTIEPRHHENVENLGVFIKDLQTFGDSYQPSNAALTIDNLILLKQKGINALDDVSTAVLANKNAIAARTYVFHDIDSLITRVANTIKICNAKQQNVDQALSIIRDIRGKRASPLLSDKDLAAEKEKGNNIVQIVKHNATMKIQTTNFGMLIKSLASMTEYNPNESDLKIDALTAKQAAMVNQNELVDSTSAVLDSKRAVRQNVLYAETTGLVSIGKSVKLYVKAAYGANSQQYKQISNLRFINID